LAVVVFKVVNVVAGVIVVVLFEVFNFVD